MNLDPKKNMLPGGRKIIKNGVEFELLVSGLNGQEYPYFEGFALGRLKWGHYALLAWYDDPGESRMVSPAAWERWWQQECQRIKEKVHQHQ